MTWLILTCPIQLPGQPEQITKRRFNMNNVVLYEPNALGGVTLLMQALGTSGTNVVFHAEESAQKVDAALTDDNSPLRVGYKGERISDEQCGSPTLGTTISASASEFFTRWGLPK